MEYTQSLTEKKHEVAGKMKYPMNGKTVSKGGKGMKTTMSIHGNKGEKYRQAGHGIEMTGGEKAIEAGKGMEHTGGMKAKGANSKGNFSSNYTQHGK